MFRGDRATGSFDARDPVRDPLDAYILNKLEEKNLTPAAPADKRTLLRRAAFDLTGLPPTSAEIDAFVKDTSPEAFEKVDNVRVRLVVEVLLEVKRPRSLAIALSRRIVP